MNKTTDTGVVKNRPRSRTQDVYQLIRADILACRRLPGQKIKISELSDRFSVSLGTVREGLSRLAAEGLLTAEPQRGFRVTPISVEDLMDLTRVRIEIECTALRQSIEHGDINWEGQIVAADHKLSQTPQRDPNDPERISESWASAHTDFHDALVDACPSRWTLKLRDLLYVQTERYRRLSVPVANRERDVVGEHRSIMEAALARDSDLAAERLRAHLSTTTEMIIDAVPLLQDESEDTVA